ncbi:MAG: cyclic nucleotide-binding domain-containing protein [Magnetospiraceae bacterium]
MRTKRRKFKDGAVLFKEGDPGERLYVVVEGRVDLTINGPDGPVPTAQCGPGEMVGVGALWGGQPRRTTARANGPVAAEEVSRNDLVAAVSSEPDAVALMLEAAAKRYRVMAVSPAPTGQAVPPAAEGAAAAPGPAGESDGKAGFWERLFTRSPPKRPVAVEVMVADLPGDGSKPATKAVGAALETLKGVRVKYMGRPLQPTAGFDPATQLPEVAALGRRTIAGRADLLIWGETRFKGHVTRLRFLSAHTEDEDRLGVFGQTDYLDFPVAENQSFLPLLCAAAVAVATPRPEIKRFLRGTLPHLLSGAQGIAKEPPIDLDAAGRASVINVFALACAAHGQSTQEAAWYPAAEAGWRAVLEILAQTDATQEWATAMQRVGMVQHALADGEAALQHLDRAIQAYRDALKVIDARARPLLFGLTQNRLGLALARREGLTGDAGNLREAIAAYGQAIRAIDKGTLPLKWSEVMNNLAGALQVLGGHQRDPDLLERAVEACRGALAVRDRDRFPAQWAATRNTMGSAYFLLAGLAGGVDDLGEAESAFEDASAVYGELGWDRLQEVAKRNLAKVRTRQKDLAAESAAASGKDLPRMPWEGEEHLEEAGESTENADDVARRRREARRKARAQRLSESPPEGDS